MIFQLRIPGSDTIRMYTHQSTTTPIYDLSLKAPTLLHVLSSIVSYSDHRNKKANSAHHPGLCMTVVILLKERNREVCGVQSLLSLLLYSSHVDKQVGICEIKKSFIVQGGQYFILLKEQGYFMFQWRYMYM